MKFAFKHLYIFLFYLSVSVMSQTLQTNFPVANGGISAMVQSGNTVYMGGSFTYVGSNTGRAALLNQTTGTYDSGFPSVNGTINAVLPDGVGGWYIGGDFTSVGSVARNCVAHIKADKSVDSWDPNVGPTGSTVYSFAKYGSTIYIGGLFSTVGVSARINLAAVDSATGVPTSSWHPDPNSAVYAIAVNDSNVFVGGSFTGFGIVDTIYNSSSRTNIASIYRTINILSVWNPAPSGGYGSFSKVYGLTYNSTDSLLYVCGNFTNIGGAPRVCIASLNTTNTAVAGALTTTFYPNKVSSIYWKNAIIFSMAISGDTVFVGGNFPKYGTTTTGTARNGLAASLISTNALLTFGTTGIAPTPTGSGTASASYVKSLAISNGVVYVGGKFTGIGAQTQGNIAALGSASGTALSWNPNASDAVNAVGLYGSNVFTGGKFTSVNGQTRNRLAAVDVSTGTLLSWDPNISTTNGTVNTLAISGSTVYVAGNFSTIGGQSRTNLAAVDATTGSVSSFQANANFGVQSLAVSGFTLYVGGTFTLIGGTATGDTTRNNIAALDATTGSVLPWNPSGDGTVNTILMSGSIVYVGGTFANIGGQVRNCIAALDATTGNATSWNPTAGGAVSSLALSGSTMYVGGSFTTIGGASRNLLAAISTADTGTASAWNPDLWSFSSPSVKTIAFTNGTVYAGGTFNTVGGATQLYCTALNASTGIATSWSPNTDGNVAALLIDQTYHKIYIGGAFSNVVNQTASNFAVVDNSGDAALPVELTAFTATIKGSTAELRWTTATEVNNYGFEVERSTSNSELNAGKWKKIGFVNGGGNSSSPRQYFFINNIGLTGTNSSYYYRLKQIDNDGKFKYSGIVEINAGSIPTRFELDQNYPNPFNPATAIRYQLPANSFVTLKVYDVLGNEVKTLVNQNQNAGHYQITFEAKNLASGLYFYQLKAGDNNLIKKMILMK